MCFTTITSYPNKATKNYITNCEIYHEFVYMKIKSLSFFLILWLGYEFKLYIFLF
jgi:hypothetical protein